VKRYGLRASAPPSADTAATSVAVVSGIDGERASPTS